MQLLPVILSGGAGTRLWPMSREAYPKQFLPLTGESSLLQGTVTRLDGLPAGIEMLPSLVVCNEAHRFLVAEQFRLIERELGGILLEPAGRNTAPALALAALMAVRNGDFDKPLNTLYIAHDEATLDAGDGYPVLPGEALQIDVKAGNTIWGKFDNDTGPVHIIQTGG